MTEYTPEKVAELRSGEAEMEADRILRAALDKEGDD